MMGGDMLPRAIEMAREIRRGEAEHSPSALLCEPCAKDVFVFTLGQAERAAASLKEPESAARDALRYAVAHIEADRAGKELTDALDVGYLRAALGADAP